MNAVVLGWVPGPTARWAGCGGRCVQQTRGGPSALERWPVGDSLSTPVGTSVHLLAQTRMPGLVGRGIVQSASWLSADPNRPGRLTHHVIVEWTKLLPLAEPIPTSILSEQVPQFPWRGFHVGVRALDPESSTQLDLAWERQSSGPGSGAVPPRCAGCHHCPVPSSG